MASFVLLPPVPTPTGLSGVARRGSGSNTSHCSLPCPLSPISIAPSSQRRSGSRLTRQAALAASIPPSTQLQQQQQPRQQPSYLGSYQEYDTPSNEDLGWRTNFGEHYLTGKLLGQGSFGQVYLGVDLHTGKEVAVKVLPKVRGKLTKDKTLEKLARECDILERLQGCPGIIRLEDVFEDSHNVLLVTELCSGGDLQKFAEDSGGLDEQALALVAEQVLVMLQACHNAGVIHGDIKPGNFCLKSRSRNPLKTSDPNARTRNWLKAIDFGCSQLLPSGTRRLSKRTGTPVYMAPEVYQRDYHIQADMWSLGVMLYQLYSQHFPFFKSVEDCKASKLEEVAKAVSEAEISYSHGRWTVMSPEGIDFISKCLNRNLRERITVVEALSHPWLAGARQAAASASGMGMSSNNIVTVSAPAA